MSPVRRLWPALALLIAIGPAASAQTTEAVDAVTAALRAGNFAQAVERSQAALATGAERRPALDAQRPGARGLGRRAEALQSFSAR